MESYDGAGRKHLCKIVDEKLSALKHAGYGLCVIGHTKLRSIKEQGMVEEQEYQVLTSNLNSDYANIVAHKADVIATINVEREVTDKRIVAEKRYIYFRGNGFVSAGSRFSNIVDRVELSSKNFIKAIEDAIKNSRTIVETDKEMEERKKKEIKEREDKAKQQNVKKEDSVEVKQEKLDRIKANMSKLDMSRLQAIMGKYGVTNFANIEAISSQCLDEILALI